MTTNLSEAVAGLLASRAETRAADVASELGISEASARTYLSRLADARSIARLGRGTYGPAQTQRVSPEPEADAPSPAAASERNSEDSEVRQAESPRPAHLALVPSADSETQQAHAAGATPP